MINYNYLANVCRSGNINRITMNIVDFVDILNEAADINKIAYHGEKNTTYPDWFIPKINREILDTGLYACIKVDDKLIDIYVDSKNQATGNIKFE